MEYRLRWRKNDIGWITSTIPGKWVEITHDGVVHIGVVGNLKPDTTYPNFECVAGHIRCLYKERFPNGGNLILRGSWRSGVY